MAEAKLTKKEIDDLARACVEERAELRDPADARSRRTPSRPPSPTCPATSASTTSPPTPARATFEREKDLSIEQNVRDLLDKIDRALKRIDEGTYGVCERCGKPIEKARIKALPYVDLCIKDAQAQSRR